MTGFYLDFNSKCAVEVIKEEHNEVSITISSSGKRYLFLEGAAEHSITWPTLNGYKTLPCNQGNH